jgi:hypothetical protein
MNTAKLSQEIAHALYDAKGGSYVKIDSEIPGQHLYTLSAIEQNLFLDCFEQAEKIISKCKEVKA